MTRGFADLRAVQEVIARPDYDQVRHVLGEGCHVAHHSEREVDGQGISIASRWPIAARHEVDLHVGQSLAGGCEHPLLDRQAIPQ